MNLSELREHLERDRKNYRQCYVCMEWFGTNQVSPIYSLVDFNSKYIEDEFWVSEVPVACHTCINKSLKSDYDDGYGSKGSVTT